MCNNTFYCISINRGGNTENARTEDHTKETNRLPTFYSKTEVALDRFRFR